MENFEEIKNKINDIQDYQMVVECKTNEECSLWFLDKVKAIPYEKDKGLEDGIDSVYSWDYPAEVISWNPIHSMINTCMFQIPYILINGRKSYLSASDYIVIPYNSEDELTKDIFNMNKWNFESLFYSKEDVEYLLDNNCKKLNELKEKKHE